MMAAWYSGRAAVADLAYRQNTPESLEKAVALAPDSAVFRALLAEHMESLNRDPKPQLDVVTRLSPLDSQYWIRRGFRAEVEGDYAATEAFLKEAARIDHKANPRWALMNFYFRRGRTDEFWAWVTKALAMTAGDASAIFRLAWDQSQDSTFILSRIPPEKQLLVQYFDFLAATQRLDDAKGVAEKIARVASEREKDRLLDYCGRYAEGDSRRALAVWNVLCERGLLPLKRLNPDEGEILTNADYSLESVGRGFDWRLKPLEGVEVGRADEGSGIRVEFTGNQPEDCILLEQTVPLSPARSYQVSWESRAGSPEMVPGLFWEMAEVPGSSSTTSSVSGTTAYVQGRLDFVATGRSGQLRLRYKRPLGAVRARGMVTVRSLRSRVTR